MVIYLSDVNKRLLCLPQLTFVCDNSATDFNHQVIMCWLTDLALSDLFVLLCLPCEQHEQQEQHNRTRALCEYQARTCDEKSHACHELVERQVEISARRRKANSPAITVTVTKTTHRPKTEEESRSHFCVLESSAFGLEAARRQR